MVYYCHLLHIVHVRMFIKIQHNAHKSNVILNCSAQHINKEFLMMTASLHANGMNAVLIEGN